MPRLGLPNPNAGRKKGVITPAMKNSGRKPKQIDTELIERVIQLRSQGLSKHDIMLDTKLSNYMVEKIIRSII